MSNKSKANPALFEVFIRCKQELNEKEVIEKGLFILLYRIVNKLIAEEAMDH